MSPRSYPVGMIPAEMGLPVPGGGDERVAVPEDVIRVGIASPVTVGDGIALEENARARRKRGNGFERAQRGQRRQQQDHRE